MMASSGCTAVFDNGCPCSSRGIRFPGPPEISEILSAKESINRVSKALVVPTFLAEFSVDVLRYRDGLGSHIFLRVL